MADHGFATLSTAWRTLIRRMQEVRYGRLESFSIIRGEPILDPAPRTVFELRVPGPRKAVKPSAPGFTLKAAVEELFQLFTRVGNARVQWLEIRDGLPTRVALEELKASDLLPVKGQPEAEVR